MRTSVISCPVQQQCGVEYLTAHRPAGWPKLGMTDLGRGTVMYYNSLLCIKPIDSDLDTILY